MQQKISKYKFAENLCSEKILLEINFGLKSPSVQSHPTWWCIKR